MNSDVTTFDGVRLLAKSIGSAHEAIIVPNAIYMEEDFAWLAEERTVIFYDLRNRGRSESVADRAKLERGLHHDVDDLEAVRRHFGVDRIDLLGHSYVALIVALYAMQHPEHTNRIVQIGPPPAAAVKSYPPELSNRDSIAGEVFAALQKMQAERSDRSPEEVCEAAWSVLRRMYVVDAQSVPKLKHWGFCELPNERNFMAYFNTFILPSLRALALSAADYAKVKAPVL